MALQEELLSALFQTEVNGLARIITMEMTTVVMIVKSNKAGNASRGTTIPLIHALRFVVTDTI